MDYKKAYFKEMKKSSYAWGQFFQARNELFELQSNIYETVGEDKPIDNNNEHLMKFIRELYADAKTKVECPICIEKIENSKELETTKCGHNFHTSCIKELKANCSNKFYDCPICRTKLYCGAN